MNVSVTIPQLFYDLIARVLPGCLFLFMLKFTVSGTGLSLKQFEVVPSNTSMGILVNGVGYLILCYFTGWVLRAFSFFGFEYKVDQLLQKSPDSRSDSLSLYEKYHKIRLKNEAAGFRIVKLRAEARMLEASRTGMCFIFAISAILLFLSKLSLVTVSAQSNWTWLLKLFIPVILALAFHKCFGPACGRYVGNIKKHHEILFGDKR